jgi:hypothetical protein
MKCENCGKEITELLIEQDIIYCKECYDETNSGRCGVIPCSDCDLIDCEHAFI